MEYLEHFAMMEDEKNNTEHDSAESPVLATS